uniref:Uncharacterized protein n=1 Tax=Glossina pallidipes TaxID=7398 RepID=A0A1A9ZWF5_GLOPL
MVLVTLVAESILAIERVQGLAATAERGDAKEQTEGHAERNGGISYDCWPARAPYNDLDYFEMRWLRLHFIKVIKAEMDILKLAYKCLSLDLFARAYHHLFAFCAIMYISSTYSPPGVLTNALSPSLMLTVISIKKSHNTGFPLNQTHYSKV